MKMKAAVLYEKKGPFVFETVDIDDPQKDEIRVKIVATGICGTDIELRKSGLNIPTILGHEGAGIVEKIGPGAEDSFKVGDKVALSYSYCGECESCSSGEFHNCDDFTTINVVNGGQRDGTGRIHKDGKDINKFMQGSFAEYVIMHKTSAVKLDDDMDVRMSGPIGCGIITGAGCVLDYIKPTYHDAIAVAGIGTIGLAVIMAAKLANCGTIVGFGRSDEKLKLAKELGATHVINSTKTDDVATEIARVTGRKMKYFIDTTGKNDIFNNGLKALDNNGEAIMLAGVHEISIPGGALLQGTKKATALYVGGANPHKFLPMIVERYKEGRFPMDRLITYYKFEELEQAMADVQAGKTIKAILTME